MQPHSSIPAPIRTGSPPRVGARILGGLLVLATIIAGSLLVLGHHTPAAAVVAPRPTRHTLIASCQPCREEMLGSQPSAGAVAQPAGPSIAVGARHTLIMGCQPCRDEVLGAGPAGITAAKLPPQLGELRQSGRR